MTLNDPLPLKPISGKESINPNPSTIGLYGYWTPLDKQEPDFETFVWAKDKHCIVKRCLFNGYDFYCNWGKEFDATHWMPLHKSEIQPLSTLSEDSSSIIIEEEVDLAPISDNGFLDLTNRIIKAIIRLNNKSDSVNTGNWISVKTRLPEPGQVVIVAGRNEDGDYQDIRRVYAAFPAKSVTHWQPLLTPPRHA